MRVGRLQMDRRRMVYAGLNAERRQVRDHALTLEYRYHVILKDVPVARSRRNEPQIVKPGVVPGGGLATKRVPAVEMSQFHPQDRRLHRIESRILANYLVDVFGSLT